MSNQNRKQQKSKLARANMKLSKMIAKYYEVNFDLSLIRKELKISDSVFSNANPLERKIRVMVALENRATRYREFSRKQTALERQICLAHIHKSFFSEEGM